MNINTIDLEITLTQTEESLKVKNAIWMKAVGCYSAALQKHKDEISSLKWDISEAEADYHHCCEEYDTLLENQEGLSNET